MTHRRLHEDQPNHQDSRRYEADNPLSFDKDNQSSYYPYNRDRYSRSSGKYKNERSANRESETRSSPQNSSSSYSGRTNKGASYGDDRYTSYESRFNDNPKDNSSRKSGTSPRNRYENTPYNQKQSRTSRRDELDRKDLSLYQNKARYAEKSPRRKRKPLTLLGILAALIVLGGGFWLFLDNRPIKIAVNGTTHEISSKATLSTIVAAGYVTVDPGDFIAVDGSVLEKGKGKAFAATIDGAFSDDPNTRLNDGNKIVLSKGNNIIEPADEIVETTPYRITEQGVGALHVYLDNGQAGVSTVKTGTISKKTIRENTTELQDKTYLRYRPNVGDDKVIALTFDDGPWPTYTEQILAVLKDNDAKATFFTVGENIDAGRASLVKKTDEAGHQVSTHTYSHARGKGKSLNIELLSAEEQIAEIQKGYDAISTAIGRPASKVIRAPGGNFDNTVQNILAPYVSAEIGWTIDAQDWKKPGVPAIVAQIQSARPGDIILLHDGGGDRAQTVEALKQALPYLKAQGFRFVTIDEMLAYPRKSKL